MKAARVVLFVVCVVLSATSLHGAPESDPFEFSDSVEPQPDPLWKIYGRAGVGVANSWFRRDKDPARLLVTRKQELDFDIAKALAEFVSVSYCEDDYSVSLWNCTRCVFRPDFVLTRMVSNDSWDVSAYVGYYPPWNAKMVIFRGTHGRDLKNWIENLKATQHQVRLNLSIPGFEDLKVHNGFSRIWNIPFKNSIMAAVQELMDIYGADGPLYVAGHSAGGATAQLAGFAFKTLMQYKDVRLYTYGSPRVGNIAFSAMLSEMMTESWRFTHNRDIVPILPWIAMGFWHSAQEVFQKEEEISLGHTLTVFRICDGTGEDPTCHDSMCRFGFGCRSVYDHYFYLNTIMEDDGSC